MIRINDTELSFSNMGLFSTREKWIHPETATETHEIICVCEGKFSIFEGGTVYELKPGDLLLLSPETMHGGVGEVHEKVRFYWVHFKSRQLEALNLQKKYTSLPKSMLYLFRELMDLQTRAEDRSLADVKLAELLLSLCRCDGDSKNKLICEVGEYIRVHSDEKLSVASVCDAFGYNRDYLSKLFLRVNGLSMCGYITRERIRLIRSYLLHTNYSVKEIADALGYENENLLVKYFKYNTGATPTEYRNTHGGLHLNKK